MESQTLSKKFSSGAWTLYFHSLREKRWTLDTFQKIGTASTVEETLALFKELGDSLKRGMFFWMRDPYPPLWENYQHIRGGSYSVRGGQDEGVEIYKRYVLASMLDMATTEKGDYVMGVTISPKVINNGNTQRVGFFVIKIWNRDSSTYNKNTGLHCLDTKITANEVLYTPHTQKKM